MTSFRFPTRKERMKTRLRHKTQEIQQGKRYVGKKKAYWRALITQWMAEGEPSVVEYCKMLSISGSRFHYWRKELRLGPDSLLKVSSARQLANDNHESIKNKNMFNDEENGKSSGLSRGNTCSIRSGAMIGELFINPTKPVWVLDINFLKE